MGGHRFAAALLFLAGTSLARELHCSAGESHYFLTFDSSKTTGLDMRGILWLSPYCSGDPHSPFESGFSEDHNGVDMWIWAPGLEQWAKRLPPAAGLRFSDADSPADVLANAGAVLDFARNEMALLEGTKVPPVLEPVKDYLRRKLKASIENETARFEFCRTGDAGAIEKYLCEACVCPSAAYDRFIEQVRPASGGTVQQRLAATAHDFHNAVTDCKMRTGDKYPIAAWQAFLKQYGIKERRTWEGID